MTRNPYEQPPFHGTIAGHQAARGGVRPEDILPAADNPLSLPLRIGYGFVSKSAWPPRGYMNVFFAYYLARTRRHWFEVPLIVVPWLFLTAIEAALIYMIPQISIIETWFGLMMLEVLLLPSLVGLLFLFILMVRFRRIFDNVNYEELACTPLAGGELVTGITTKPIAAYSLGLIVNTVALLALYVETALEGVTNFDRIDACTTFSILVILGLRFFLLRALGTHAVASTLRVFLMMKDSSRAMLRALRDYLVPWPLVLLLGPPVILGLSGIGLMAGVLPVGCVGSILLPFVIAMAAAMAEEKAGRILQWLGRNPRHWALGSGEESLLVPRKILEPWRVDYSKKPAVRRDHPLTRGGPSNESL